MPLVPSSFLLLATHLLQVQTHSCFTRRDEPTLNILDPVTLEYIHCVSSLFVCLFLSAIGNDRRKPFKYQEDAPDGGLMDFLEGHDMNSLKGR